MFVFFVACFFQRNIAGARDPEVLSLFATAIEKLGGTVQQYVPRIMEAVFECTLLMITQNFEVGFMCMFVPCCDSHRPTSVSPTPLTLPRKRPPLPMMRYRKPEAVSKSC